MILLMPDTTPPPMSGLEMWAIVSPDQIGPPCSAGKDRSQRLVARPEGSHLEVVYDRDLERAGQVESTLADKINILVMAGDKGVLTRGAVERIILRQFITKWPHPGRRAP